MIIKGNEFSNECDIPIENCACTNLQNMQI